MRATELAVIGTGRAPARLTVVPTTSSFDFGDQAIGTEATILFTVRNVGGVPASGVESTLPTGAFSFLEGFSGHADEWWHFSWGDQMWAALTGSSAAHYGLAQLP